MTIALYPWETVEDVTREQIEAEILTDAEFQQWLDEIMAVPVETMTELEYMTMIADQLEAQPGAEMLIFAEETLMFAPRNGGWSAELLAGAVAVLPDWQRDDYVGA